MDQSRQQISLKYVRKNQWKEFKDMSQILSTKKNFRIISQIL